MITREECIAIIDDLTNEIDYWDWEEDYYKSGLDTREEWIDWTKERLNKIKQIINDNLD